MTVCKLFITNQCIKDIERLLAKEKDTKTELETEHELPARLTDIPQMTDDELDELKEAVEESFGRILTIETGLRAKLIQIDNELIKRQS